MEATKTLTLQERARAERAHVEATAAEREAEEAAAQQVLAIERLREQLQRVLRVTADPTEKRITIDGLTFGPGTHGLWLYLPCPKCQTPTPNGPIHSLFDLACHLDSRPETCELCKDKRDMERWVHTPTLEARLADVLREFIAAETARGEG